MEVTMCDIHRQLRNDKNLFFDRDSAVINSNDCKLCNNLPNRSSQASSTLFNIAEPTWQDRDNFLQNPLFVTTNSAESRLSLNSGDSIDAPLLLNEQYNEFEDMDEFHCHSNNIRKQDNNALRKLLAATCMCLFFMIAEIIGGYLANSLSVMTDAAHLLSDFIGFLVSVFSIWLGQRSATKRNSWGFHRAEVLGALFSIVFIWLLTAIFTYLAILRLMYGKYHIDANTMMLVATIGVFINLVMGMILHALCPVHNSGRKHSHNFESQGNINVRAAIIHVFGDFIQSIGVLIAAIIIKINPDAKVADPICTFIFSIIVIFTTKNVIRDTINVLMEAVPLNVNYNCVADALRNIDGVRHVHNLHIWSLTMNKTALTVHLAVDKFCDKEEILHLATKLVRSKFSVSHVTVQVEKYREEIVGTCVDCQMPVN